MYFIVLDCKNGAIKFNYAACAHIRKIMPIMLALCLMLLHTYYAKNYAGIIDSGLVTSTKINVRALHANFSCNCPQTCKILKILRKSYKIHMCYSLACLKFKSSCTIATYVSETCLFFVRDIIRRFNNKGDLPLHFDQQKKHAPCEHVAHYCMLIYVQRESAPDIHLQLSLFMQKY